MKKRTQSGSGRTSRVLLSGAGAAFLTGAVAEGATFIDGIYSDYNFNLTLSVPSGSGPLDIGFVLGSGFQLLTLSLPDHKLLVGTEVGIKTIFSNPATYLPSALRTNSGAGNRMMGLALHITNTAKLWYGFEARGFVKAPNVGAGITPNASNLALGDWINGLFPMQAAGRIAPAWDLLTPGFLGVKFIDSGAGKSYFGWIQITDVDMVGGVSLTIGGYGIQTAANTAIQAGYIGNSTRSGGVATPEPATTGLALLALGAAGVMRHRRKREAAA